MKLSVSAKGIQWPPTLPLPLSKSVANRVLMLAAWANQSLDFSTWILPDDVQNLRKVLNAESTERSIGEGGTSLRFILPYLAFRGTDRIQLEGAPRLGQRPIQPLLDALRQMGAQCSMGSPDTAFPLEIQPTAFPENLEKVTISAEASSQFASALAMAGAFTPRGLLLEFSGNTITSRSYLDLTVALLRASGVRASWKTDRQLWIPKTEHIHLPALEADWTSHHYWQAWMQLFPPAHPPAFPGLNPASAQGDRAFSPDFRERVDFSNHPDLALTYIPLWAGMGKTGTFTGLHTLNLKESNRLDLMIANLKRLGFVAESKGPDQLTLHGGQFQSNTVKTAGDHRMAMGFAIMAAWGPIGIDNPECVSKSYPQFWEHLASIGVLIE